MTRLEHRLRKSAERFPDRVAVQLGERELRYGELDRDSDRLAAHLVRLSVRPGDRVAHYLDKSPEALVSIFGILKAGAAYVPLDPGGPPDRARTIMAGAGIRVVVSSARKLGAIRRIVRDETPVEHVVLLDVDSFDGEAPEGVSIWTRADLEGDSPSALADGETPAYVLYTSGSTGTPKGVTISHRASLAFVEWAGDTFSLTEHDVVSSHAPFQFDLSIFDIFSTIRAGGRICLIPPGANMFPRTLAELIEKQRITTWYSVPSALVHMVRARVLAGRDLSNLRQILFAGEPFPLPALRELMQQVPHASYHNLYGPTETNVCTWYPLPGPPDPQKSLPIGKPCCGDEAFILDERGEPVPDGEVGELAIRGPTVMSGYLNNPDATAKSLRPHPDGRGPIYLTGDLVRRLPDGNLEFHGRRDNMVKTRGYRVELGEIEAAAVRHEGVEEAVAVPVPDDEVGTVIHAWVQPKGEGLRAPDVLRFLKERLPGYMVPERLYVLEEGLPRTTTGKADRKRLAEEAAKRAADAEDAR